MLKFSIIATIAAAMSFAVQAQPRDNDLSNDIFVGQEVDLSFEVSRARLLARGYTLIAMLASNPLRLSAVDPQGHDVHLRINPQTGLVQSTRDIDAMDQ